MSFAPLNALPGSPATASLPLWQGGAVPSSLKVNLGATVDPSATDDSDHGYSVFSFWLNNSTRTFWLCVGATPGSALWQQVSGASPSPISPIASGSNLVFEGDGLTLGTESSSFKDYPSQLMTLPVAAGRGLKTSFATVGATLADIAARYSTSVHNYAPVVTGIPAYLFVWIGYEDFYTGTYANAAAYVAVLQSYWQQAQADGFKVVAFTIPPRNDTGKVIFDNVRWGINDLIRKSLIPDLIVDAECQLVDPSDALIYQSDFIYLTDVGYGLIARLVATALLSNGAQQFGPLTRAAFYGIAALATGHSPFYFRNLDPGGNSGIGLRDANGVDQGSFGYLNGQGTVIVDSHSAMSFYSNNGLLNGYTNLGVWSLGFYPYTAAGPTLQLGKQSNADGGMQAIYLSGGSASAPATVAAGTGAGTTPTVSVVGTAMAGFLTVLTGTTPGTSSVVATVTLGDSLGAAPRVILTPRNAAAAALTGAGAVYVSAETVNTFAISVGSTALAGATTYEWNYHIIQ